MTEGYIKFNCNWDQTAWQIPEEIYNQLETARTELCKLGLIGMYPDGVGFGNISVRVGGDLSFIITGSATGQFTQLKPEHYALVHEFSFSGNSISCKGQTKASAESLSHAAVYESLPEVGAVVHVHNLCLWEKLLNRFPSTSAGIEYGTPEMAYAVARLASEIDGRADKIIVMGGHREGILAFGSTLSEATAKIVKIYNQYKND